MKQTLASFRDCPKCGKTYSPLVGHACPVNTRIAELEAQLAACQPVPVDLVPEEWRDGRELVYWERNFDSGCLRPTSRISSGISHISQPLPDTPATTDKGDEVKGG